MLATQMVFDSGIALVKGSIIPKNKMWERYYVLLGRRVLSTVENAGDVRDTRMMATGLRSMTLVLHEHLNSDEYAAALRFADQERRIHISISFAPDMPRERPGYVFRDLV